MTLDRLNILTERDAMTLFRQCCNSVQWARGMQAKRPFKNIDELQNTASIVWNSLTHDDWREAFSHHPRIGDIKELRRKFPTTAHLAEGEQSRVASTTERVLKALADGNKLYEAKFGYIFIVCATGKSAEEMLEMLTARLHHYPADEIAFAATEQATITKLRIEKIMSDAFNNEQQER